MRRMVMVALAVGLAMCVSTMAAGAVNLVENPGFENWNGDWYSPDFANWNEYGTFGASSDAHSGSMAIWFGAGPGIPSSTSIVSNKINIAEMGTYEFGVWVKLYSDSNPSVLYNGDKAGITANIYWDGGGASYYYEATEFTSASGWKTGSQGWGFETDWFLISGLFDVGAPVLNSELNISLQNWTNTVWRDTSVRADDAFLQKVPEPSALILLGSGMIGLVAYRRSRRMA